VAVRTASRVYHAIGTEIRKRPVRVLKERVRVSSKRKLMLFARSLVTTVVGHSRAKLPSAAEQALTTASQLLQDHGVS
jgi:hypothetical protein